MKEMKATNLDSRRVALASRWSLYSWGAILVGLILTKPLYPSANGMASVFIMSGIVFAVIAFCLAVVGMVRAQHNRAWFLLPLGLSTPQIAFQIWTML